MTIAPVGTPANALTVASVKPILAVEGNPSSKAID
jgi:hypothetical protein